jgi:hypothetical protein
MEDDKYNDLKSPEKMEDYNKAIEYLSLAEMHMSKALSGKNRRGVLTDISNVAYRIKSEYLND